MGNCVSWCCSQTIYNQLNPVLLCVQNQRLVHELEQALQQTAVSILVERCMNQDNQHRQSPQATLVVTNMSHCDSNRVGAASDLAMQHVPGEVCTVRYAYMLCALCRNGRYK